AGTLTYCIRFDLADNAFDHTAVYDGAIANYLGGRTPDNDNADFPRTFNAQFVKVQDMRYGENPHQRAAFYAERNPKEACVATAKQVQGKELSYNNVSDTYAARLCEKTFAHQSCLT